MGQSLSLPLLGLLTSHPWTLLATLPTLIVLSHLLPYLLDTLHIRANAIPGPFWAKFTDAWLATQAAGGHRSEVVHEMHKKYGTFIRLAPNHISIAHPDALQVVYAHGNGTLKSNFYDAFVSIRRGVFNTRSRTEHTRKRKIISHVFSQKSVLEFEPHIRLHVGELLEQWDRLCAGGVRGEKGEGEGEGEGGWEGRDGRTWLDCLPWYNYLAFDIIGDLAFGSPFGMIKAARDSAPVAKHQEHAMASYGKEGAGNDASITCETINIPAVQILNDRGDYSATMGTLPPWFRPIAKKIPWFAKGNKAVKNLAGLAVAAVAKRLANPTDRSDLLAKLQQGKDDEGSPMGREELTAEALTQLIAGSDTTSNSSCAITYHLARYPAVQTKLQRELDEVLGPISSDLDEAVTTFDQVKRLPYLEACINEGLRIHSTSSMGLPRVVPEGGLEVLGKRFEEGTVLSVPSYTIHRDEEVWGEDVEVFRPERWLAKGEELCGEGRDVTAIQKTFNPFSFGPRACVGKNLANMELLIIVSSILRRYEFVLESPEKALETREGFLRKPLECRVGMRRRNV